MVIIGRPMNSNGPQRCPFDKFLIGIGAPSLQMAAIASCAQICISFKILVWMLNLQIVSVSSEQCQFFLVIKCRSNFIFMFLVKYLV